MYKSRLNLWGFGKYASRQDWLAVALLKHHMSYTQDTTHFSDPQSQPSRLSSPIRGGRVNVPSDIHLKPSQPQFSHPTMALHQYLEQAVNPMTGIMPTSPSYTEITRV